MSKSENALMAHLEPDLIYRFNQMFIEAWRRDDIGRIHEDEGTSTKNKTALFTLSYFNSYTRTFNWVSVGENLWDCKSEEWDEEKNEKTVNALINILKSWKSPDKELQNKEEDKTFNTNDCGRKKAWEDLWNEFPKSGIYNTAKEICKDLKFDNKESQERLQRAMLGLYSGIHFEEEKNIEGVFVGYLRKLQKPVKHQQTNYLSGTLKNFPECNEQKAPFDWLELDDEFVSDWGLKKYQNIRDPDTSSSSSEKPEDTNPLKAEGVQELGEKFFEELLLKSGLPESDNSNFSNELAKRGSVVLAPIYDVWIDGKKSLEVKDKTARLPVCGFGCIKAVVLCWFRDENRRNKWLIEKLPPLLSQLSTVSSGIIESSKAQALSQPITPPYDLLRHFLSILTYVQDWESAYVVDTTKTRGEKGYVPFCYERQKKSGSPIVDWKEGTVKTNCIDFPCNTDDESTIQIQCSGNKNFMWWTTDLWSKDLIYSLGDEERNAFSRFAIRFEFPEACYIPAETEIQKQMRNAYLRQQLDLMNSLIPKVQTRRAALRSAVSAIMGRNMSHNIGSHVIARYAAIAHAPEEQRERGIDLKRGEIDHRTVFFQYLQKRMDFIAEVSTSDKPNWSQPLGLVKVLDALNFDKEKEQINKTTSTVFDPKPILLSYITGKEGINASVCIDEHTKEYFNCPSGDVGVHALYVILENIIRNSARHNTKKGSEGELKEVKLKEVKLKVEVIDSDHPELLKLEITDCQTEELEITDCQTEEEEESGKPLDEHINGIIQNEPFLNEDGSPNSKYWGIREMQICAQHLRGLPLSELEAPPPRPPSNLAAAEEEQTHTEGDGDDTPRVLEAFINEKNNKPRLAYRLYLQRPKLCAVVVDEICCELRSEEARKKLQKIGVMLFEQLPEDIAELRGYNFAVLPGDLEKELSDRRLQLPVRTLYVEDCCIKQLFSDITSWVNDPSKFSPAKLLDPLHQRLWNNRYKEKRDCWKDKKLKTLVGWENWPGEDEDENNWLDEEKSKKEKDVFLFSHAYVDLTPYKEWGGKLQQDSDIGLVWVDHGTDDKFKEDVEGPKLICAAENLSVSYYDRNDRNEPIIFAETFDSLSQHKSVLKDQMNTRISGISGDELIAAALARVIILDERVQSLVDKIYRADMPYATLWPCMGIWIPPDTKKCDLNNPDLEKIKCFLNNPMPEKPEQLPADFLVLHLTILENLAKQDGKNEQETLNELRKCCAIKEDCEIVIVSGRGVPSATINSDIEKTETEKALNERFLPISALLEHISQPSKLALMRSLWSA